MNYKLSIEQQQKLIMTQELRQSIEILQLNTLELIEYLNQQILDNPCLEMDCVEYEELSKSEEMADEKDWERFINDSALPANCSQESSEYSFLDFYKEEKTLKDFLMEQLSYLNLTRQELFVGTILIENINDCGYFKEPLEQMLPFLQTDIFIAKKMFDIIRSFEPKGVGGVDLKDCLLLQVADLSEKHLVKRMIRTRLSDIADNHLEQIAKEEKVSLKDVVEAVERIKALNPLPGSSFSSGKTVPYVLIDAEIIKKDTEDAFEVNMNETSLPRLYINNNYENILAQEEDSEAKRYVKKKLDQALWIIQSVEQRRQTIQKVIESIVKKQSEFFNYGEKYLKPMRLKDVADEIGVHESTVSRSTNGKYIRTDRGTYELKEFFTNGLGSEVSSVTVKTHMREMIEGEDKKKPLSDSCIEKLLKKRGLTVSRRTIAKYREEMGIRSSNKRKIYE